MKQTKTSITDVLLTDKFQKRMSLHTLMKFWSTKFRESLNLGE